VPEDLEDYLGIFAWPELDEMVRVEWRGGALTLVWAHGAESHPVLERTHEPDVFLIRGGRETGERCSFVRGTKGDVVGADVAGYPLDRLRGWSS
jgi:hypothetical protein